ncbi:MAG: tryptophan synthase subunit beta, partial [Myxococcales bacterium]|nr:tryptophan synthase subunit beta [Myxococcales bacterium]
MSAAREEDPHTGPAPLLADFGEFGGRYVAETLMPAVEELAREWPKTWADPEFQAKYRGILRDYVGRPTALTAAPRLAAAVGAGEVYLKREDLCHTGAHKINNCIGQVLLAKRLGKTRIIAETGA